MKTSEELGLEPVPYPQRSGEDKPLSEHPLMAIPVDDDERRRSAQWTSVLARNEELRHERDGAEAARLAAVRALAEQEEELAALRQALAKMTAAKEQAERFTLMMERERNQAREAKEAAEQAREAAVSILSEALPPHEANALKDHMREEGRADYHRAAHAARRALRRLTQEEQALTSVVEAAVAYNGAPTTANAQVLGAAVKAFLDPKVPTTGDVASRGPFGANIIPSSRQ